MRHYFFGKINGKDIPLFAIEERKNPHSANYNDLLINFFGNRLSKMSDDIEELFSSIEEKHYSKVNNPHISVHYNPTQEYLFIKKTGLENTHDKILSVKDGDLFAPVTLRIFGRASLNTRVKEKYLRSAIMTNVNYDCSSDTLVGFFVFSKNDINFFKDIKYPANFFEYRFSNFKLIFIYRYFNKPSLKQSISFTRSIKDNGNQMNYGLQWWEVCNLMNDLQNIYNEKYFELYP